MKRITKYIFLEITKGFALIFFIFLSISWLLQFTRLISLTNLIQVDIIVILLLSTFLIPNLISIIMPFAIMFGLLITFIKLNKDRELISIYSLGLNIKSIRNPLIIFSIIIIIISIIFNFYLSPKVYKIYKVKEYEIRNKIDFEKVNISNFIEINKDTLLDFKKEGNKFKEVFIKFKDNKENLIFAKEANIYQNNNELIFKLINGFKITLNKTNEVEKLEFNNYTLNILNKSYTAYNNFDINTFNIFEDLTNKNYINIFYKFVEIIIIIILFIFFYLNNIKKYNFSFNNLISYISLSSIFLIINQILKNSEIDINFYGFFLAIILIILLTYMLILNKNA